MSRINFDINELAGFLVEAKKNTYAGDGREVEPQRPGFKELEFIKGDWSYRDSYVGYYCAPGQEIVRFKGQPVWAMSYDGGMREVYQTDIDLTRRTFEFLKKALSKVPLDNPFRGPDEFIEDHFIYTCDMYGMTKGNVKRFSGKERISNVWGFLKNVNDIFEQAFAGGLIIPK